MDDKIIKTKYNIVGNFITTFRVEDLEGSNVQFKLTGDGEQACIMRHLFVLMTLKGLFVL